VQPESALMLELDGALMLMALAILRGDFVGGASRRRKQRFLFNELL
jgi:hypothetical protein